MMREDIDEAIKARIERFNRLYKKATGHTFEEDPEWCEQKEKEELTEWQKKVDDDFEELLWNKPRYSSNYGYEMMVINQAKEIANFFISKGIPTKEKWDKYAKDNEGNYVDCFEFVKNLQSDGFDKWDDGHSGNSGSCAVKFAHCLIFKPELFPYLHGALSPLIGDEGYHDDRKDIPNFSDNAK